MGDINEIKWHIFHALDDLLKKTSLDKVTTTQLCEASHISRQTFYRHFQDKYWVLNWYFDIMYKDTLMQIGRKLSWEQALYQIFSDMYSNNKTIHIHSHSNDYNSIRNYAYRISSKLYIETLINYKKISPSNTLLFQADTAAFLCTTLIDKWQQNGMKETPREFAALLVSVLPQELKYTLEKGIS